MLDLKNVAQVTGGAYVTAASESVLTQQHEEWLEDAGFGSLKRATGQDWVGFRFKNQNLMLKFETNHRGDLLWTTKLFGQEGDIFGKAPQKVTAHDELAVKDLKKLKASAEKLDAALEAYHVNYTATR